MKKGGHHMTEQMQFGRKIPEYYDTMYLDGYSPYEILHATHNTIYQQHQDRQEAAQRARDEAIIPTINFKSTVKVIK